MRKILVPGLVSMLPLLAAAAEGAASSIITLPAPEATPSIMAAGEAEARAVEAHPVDPAAGGTEILAIGQSVVAVGADAIPPSREAVAAIGGETAEPEAPALPGWLADDDAPALRGGLDRKTAPQD